LVNVIIILQSLYLTQNQNQLAQSSELKPDSTFLRHSHSDPFTHITREYNPCYMHNTNYFFAVVLLGTSAPFFRAFDKAIAMACLRDHFTNEDIKQKLQYIQFIGDITATIR